MKRCSRCWETKPESEYYRSQRASDGLYSHCKKCHNKDIADRQKTPEGRAKCLARVKRYQATAKGKATIRAYVQSERGKEVRRGIDQRLKARRPELSKAHHAVFNEKRAGRLIKQNCEVCGDPKTEAHHDDYDKPLDVRWLCKKHHEEHHHGM